MSSMSEVEIRATPARVVGELAIVGNDENLKMRRLEIIVKGLVIPAGIDDIDDVDVALSMLEAAVKGLRHDELLQFNEAPGAAKKMQTMKRIARILREEMHGTLQ